jgi:hypothetical protein
VRRYERVAPGLSLRLANPLHSADLLTHAFAIRGGQISAEHYCGIPDRVGANSLACP